MRKKTMQPDAPYAAFGIWLVDAVGRQLAREFGGLANTTDVAAYLEASNSTASEWLRGVRRPHRAQCARIAEKLHITDKSGAIDYEFVITKAGHPKLADNMPATVPELIQYIERSAPKQWNQEHRRQVLQGLRIANNDHHDYVQIVGNIAAYRSQRLATRAERIAQVAELIDRDRRRNDAQHMPDVQSIGA